MSGYQEMLYNDGLTFSLMLASRGDGENTLLYSRSLRIKKPHIIGKQNNQEGLREKNELLGHNKKIRWSGNKRERRYGWGAKKKIK